MPVAVTSAPKMVKNSLQRPCCVSPSKSPKMTSMEMSGSVAITDSARPRFVSSVASVSQALKAASLAVEPKKVITQSSTTIITAAADTALAAGKSLAAFSTVTRPKAAVETPQRM